MRKLKRRIPSKRERLKIEAKVEGDLPDNISVPEGGPQIIKRYPQQKCVVEGCELYAVGKGDICKKHGGDPIIRENLVPSEKLPSCIVGNIYDPAYHPITFIEMAREGGSEVEIAAAFEISVHTMRTWSEKFSEFNSAYEIGQAMHEAWWLRQGKDNLDNRGYNVGLFKFLTGNKLGYSDKMESKNLHVHAGVLQVPGTVSEDDWEKKHASEN